MTEYHVVQYKGIAKRFQVIEDLAKNLSRMRDDAEIEMEYKITYKAEDSK